MNSPQLPRKGKPLGYGFSILQILLSADKRCPQGLKPGTFEIYGIAEPCRLGHPRLVPCFHRSFFLNMSSSATPGSPAAVCTQFLHRQRWPSSLQYRLGSPILPANPFHAGGTARRLLRSVALQPADLFTLLTDRTGSASSPRGFLLPGFRRFGHPLRRRLLLRWQLGNFHRRDLHPLEWQLASRPTKVEP